MFVTEVKNMTYNIVTPHGYEGPRGKRSYLKMTPRAFKSRQSAKAYAKQHTMSGVKYPTSSSLKKCATPRGKRDKLFYIS